MLFWINKDENVKYHDFASCSASTTPNGKYQDVGGPAKFISVRVRLYVREASRTSPDKRE